MKISAVVLLCCFLGGGVQAQQNDDDTTLTLIHINDHHSHFFEASLDLSGDSIPPGLSVTTNDLRTYHGGSARISATIKALKAQAEANGEDVCVLHAGDATTGTLYYTLLGSDPDAAVMNALGFDAFVPGNHEFDDGDAQLAELSQKLNFSVVSYNLMPAESSPIRALEGTDHAIQPYIIKTLSSGDRVGICGISPKVAIESSSFPDQGTTLIDEVVAAESCVADLEGEGVDHVVVVSHIGYDEDLSRLAAVPGIDVLVGGHTHTLLGNDDLAAFGFQSLGQYAEIVDGTCVVQAWEYSKIVGKVSVTFSADGTVEQCSGGQVIPINPDKFNVEDADPEFELNGTDVQIVRDYLLSFDTLVDYGEDQAVLDLLVPFTEQIEAESSQQIATVPENICHTRDSEVDPQCPGKEDLSRVGGGVCPLVATSFMESSPTADFAIQNAGGCRTDILAGPFTYGNAFEVLPFSNTLVNLKLTGDQVRRTIEDGFNFFLDPELGGGSGSFPISAGLRWHVDYNKPFGERITNLEMNSRLEGQWEPLDLEQSYTVVTHSFISGGRDGYFTFLEVDQSNPEFFVNTYVEYGQSLVNYAEAKGTIVELPISQISTQVLTFSDGDAVDLRVPDEAAETETSEADIQNEEEDEAVMDEEEDIETCESQQEAIAGDEDLKNAWTAVETLMLDLTDDDDTPTGKKDNTGTQIIWTYDFAVIGDSNETKAYDSACMAIRESGQGVVVKTSELEELIFSCTADTSTHIPYEVHLKDYFQCAGIVCDEEGEVNLENANAFAVKVIELNQKGVICEYGSTSGASSAAFVVATVLALATAVLALL